MIVWRKRVQQINSKIICTKFVQYVVFTGKTNKINCDITGQNINDKKIKT